MQGKRNKTIISRITENRNFGLLLGLAVLLIIAAIVTPSMYSLNSILSMLQNNAVFGLLALGEMVVIITAGIDISIGASLSLAGVVCCRFMAENPEIPAVVWVVVAMLVRSNQWNFGWISENGANDRNTGNDVYFQGSFVPFE